jgi:hypothetical protein
VDVTLEAIRAEHIHVGEIDSTRLRSVYSS